MGGEWPLLSVLDEFDVVVFCEPNNDSKIFPPKQYRPLILEKMHKTGKKSDSMYMRARLTYTWPSIQKDIKAHVDACTLCLELQPSQPQAYASGLNIPVENLKLALH